VTDLSRTETLIERAKRFLSRRQGSYRRVFNQESVDVQAVLHDLAKFCRANETTFDTDERLTALLLGRREVFLRIAHHLRLTQDELWAIYLRKDIE
jgi:hypothetical protein